MSADAPVILYEHDNYGGRSVMLQYGKYDTMPWAVAGKQLSSLKIAPLTRVTLNPMPGNMDVYIPKVVLMGPLEVPSLRPAAYNFNDKTQSLKVEYIQPDLNTQVACCRGTANVPCGAYKPGSAICNTTYGQYCPGKMDSQCKNWCELNPGLCDDMVIKWCKANPNDPYCSCINSTVQSKLGANPKCYDANCIKYGYQTSSMRNINCPSIVSCEMQVNLSNAGTQLGTYIPLEQNCGAKTSTTTAQEGTTTVDNGEVTYTPPSMPAPIPETDYSILIFVVFTFFLLIAGLMYVLLSDSESFAAKKSSSPHIHINQYVQ